MSGGPVLTNKAWRVFLLGWHAPGLNQLRREYRSHHAYKRLLATTMDHIVARGGPLPSFGERPVRVRYARTYVRLAMDWDNLGASFKPIGDALVRLGVIADDSPRIVRAFSMEQPKAQQATELGTMIEITPILAEEPDRGTTGKTA